MEKDKPNTPTFNVDEIKSLIDLLKTSGLNEIEVANKDQRIRLVHQGAHQTPQALTTATPQVQAGQAADHVNKGTSAGPNISSTSTSTKVTAPTVGIFYRAPGPSAAPYVEVGSRVNKGEALCLLEAMKMMTPLQAEQSGTVQAILVEDGEAVEYGQTLFLIQPI